MDGVSDEINIKIEVETGDGISKLDSVIYKLQELDSQIKTSTDLLKVLSNAFNSIGNSTATLKKAFNEVTETTKQMNQNLAPDTSKIEQSIAPVNEMGETLKSLLKIEKERDEAAASSKAEDEQKSKLKSLQSTLLKYTNALKKATDISLKFATTTAKMGLKGLGGAMFGGAAKSINEMGSNLRNLMKNLSKYTLALYGIRSAFYAVRNVTNEYLNSQNLAAQQLKVNIEYIKYSLGSLLAPVIEYLTNLIYKLLQLIQSLVYYFAKVNIFANNTAKSMGGASSAAKELKKQMQGFDELNNIDFNTSAGSGSGINAPTLDLSEIKPLFPDFDDVGIILAEKINEALENIDWERIQSTVEKGALYITDFFNDFTKTIDGNLIGKSLAELFNTALLGLNTFFQNYDWQVLGQRLAQGLSGMINTLNWEDLGKQLTNGFRAQILTFYGFIETFNEWDKLGRKVGDMINSAFANIPWDKLGKALGGALVGLLNTLNSFLETVNWEQIGRDIGTFLSNINWTEILSQVFKVIGNIAKGLFEGIWGFLDSGTEAKVIAGIVGSLLLLKGAFKGLDLSISAIKGIIEFKNNLSTLGNVLSKIITPLKAFGTEFKVGFELLKIGAISIKDFAQALLGTFGSALLTATGAITALVSFVSMLKDGFSALKETFMVLGIAIATVGAILLGAAAPIAIIAGAVVALVATLAIATVEIFKQRDGIKSVEKASEDYGKTLDELIKSEEKYEDSIEKVTQAQDNYENAIDSVQRSQERLSQAEKDAGINGKELYDQVQNGTLKYKDMTTQQKEVYRAYKDTLKAEEELRKAEEEEEKAIIENNQARQEMIRWQKQETKDSIELELSLAKERKEYDSLKESITDAFEQGQISAEEARDYLERAMANMSNDAKQTFLNDIPDSIKEGINPSKYDSYWNRFRNWFGEKWNNMSNVVGNWFNTYIKPWFTIEKWKELADQALNAIRQKFENFSAKLKLPHLSWETGGVQASGAIKTILETLNLPTSLPKLKVNWYAKGGFPDEGELFVAREAGAEMVGSISGRTAVANNDQIVEGISRGVYEAVVQAMNETDSDDQRQIIVNLGNKTLYSGFGEYVNSANNKYGTNVVRV